MSDPRLGAPTGPARTIDGTVVRQYEHGWTFRWRSPIPRVDERRAEGDRLKRRYLGEPVGGEGRHAGRRRRPFDDAMMADLAARAARFRPIRPIDPDDGLRAAVRGLEPGTFVAYSGRNCLQSCLATILDVEVDRVPKLPLEDEEFEIDWFERFVDDVEERFDVTLEMVPAPPLGRSLRGRWILAVDLPTGGAHAIAMRDDIILTDPAGIFATGCPMPRNWAKYAIRIRDLT